MYSQVSDRLELAGRSGHRFRGEAFAHSTSLISAFIVVDSSGGVVAAFPADGDRGVIAESMSEYKVNVSMQEA